MRIDLNCDLGEGCADDDAMLDIVTSANIACGFHAGDANMMRRTIENAKQRHVRIGAHPSFLDREGFGRRALPGFTSTDIENLIAYQVGALSAIASMCEYAITHVKLHGALYNLAARSESLSRIIAQTIVRIDSQLIFVVQAGTAMERGSVGTGVTIAREVFADRAYDDDGLLVLREQPDAVIHDPDIIAARAIAMIRDRVLITQNNKKIACDADTICVHGDTPGAVAIARALRNAIEREGFELRAFGV